MSTQTVFNIDEHEATCFFSKIFTAEVSAVWKGFAEQELLDQWWAPAPWKAQTLKHSFTDGGTWHYAMKGPEGEEHFAGVDYNEINENRSISLTDYFTDEAGTVSTDLPVAEWLIGFTGVADGTKLTVNFHFKSVEEMNRILDMGFKDGFLTGMEQLEQLIAQQKR